MPESKYTILKCWPGVKDDLLAFIADTDAWIITSLKEAYKTKDWDKVEQLIDVMEMVHNMAHNH